MSRRKKSAMLERPASERPVLGEPGLPTKAMAQAPKVVRFSSDYYDAATTARDFDFGPYRGGLYEDFHFTGATRRVVLGRLRREVRNNPYLAGLYNKYPEAIGNTSLRSRTSDPAYNEAKDLLWFRRTKRMTINGWSLRRVERIVCTEMLVAGELFVVLMADGRIQLISSEFCGSPGNSTRYGEREVNGILYAASGTPAAYRFGKLTEWGSVSFTGDASELVPARNVIHIFEPDRVLMGRGLPWLLASVKSARDLYEITRSKTKQIKDANCFVGFIEKEGAAQYLDGLSTDTAIDVTPETATSPADKQSAETPVLELKPGMFFGLEKGEQVKQLMSQYEATDYKELIMLMLHAISTPVGLPVELWFSGLGDVNYSGFKGLGVQWSGRRKYVCSFIEESFLDRLQFWWVSKAAAEGELPPNPDADDDLVQWGWKRTAVLDDEKSAKSNQVRLDSGECSLADVWDELGQFPEEVLEGRRQLWIKLQIATGKLDPAGDHTAVEVPELFLLRGQLAEENGPAAAPGGGTGPTEDSEEDEDADEEKDANKPDAPDSKNSTPSDK